jgi:hypothetical protein
MNTIRLLVSAAIIAAAELSITAAPPDESALNFGPTLTHAAAGGKPPRADGFLQRWLILEPIHASGLTDNAVQREVKTTYSPDQFTVIPRDGDKIKAGDLELTWHAVDTENYNVNLFHFAQSLHKPTSDVLFWAVTVIDSPEEKHDVRLAIGSNAASVWWVNGQEVLGIYGDRQTVIDDGVSKRLTLKKGVNVIRCAVVNAGGATDFCARFLDQNDQPITGLTIRLPDGK